VDGAGVRLLLLDEKAHECGLAGARRPDQEHELALLDVDRHVAEGDGGPFVCLGDVVETNHE
jgi:hypothetical protein